MKLGGESLTYSVLNIVAETESGHVSNVKLIDYLDQARKDWYHYCILLGVEAVVVHIGADFKKEVFNHEKLLIRTWLKSVGNTSFTLKQTVVNEHKELVVSADVVLTTIHRQMREKVTVPEGIRRLLKGDDVLELSHLTTENGNC